MLFRDGKVWMLPVLVLIEKFRYIWKLAQFAEFKDDTDVCKVRSHNFYAHG